MNQEKTHYISITCIIRKNNKYLICKRSEKEKLFPGKWCVPGGKLEQSDFISIPQDVEGYWLGLLEKTAIKEVKEETNLEIKNIGYVSNLAIIRPNGYSTIIISLKADHAKGEVKLAKDELTDHVWVTLEEAKEYDLLTNLYEQMEKVDEATSS